MRIRSSIFFLALGSVGLVRPADAQPSLVVHAEGAAAHLVGPDKSSQFGWGGLAGLGAELSLARPIGVEVEGAFLGLSAAKYQDPRFAPSSTGSIEVGLAGLRIRPFAFGVPSALDGVWLGAGAGVGDTGGQLRPAIDARLGFDAKLSAAAVGPYLAFLQLVEPNAGPRGADPRAMMFGFHASYDFGHRVRVTPIPTPPPRDDVKIAKVSDRDGDGIPDALDECPDEAEDKDGFEDSDGCPDLDNDHDGIADAVDQCPNEPETFNGFADDDGCPDEQQVRVVGDRIVLDDRVHFMVDQSVIEVRSYGLLTSVAKLLNAHPEYELVEIDGHTDDTGTGEYNMRLSEARARSVKAFLVKLGVAGDRLGVKFYGQTRPRVEGTSRAARQENRRVEFEIIKRRGEALEAGSDKQGSVGGAR